MQTKALYIDFTKVVLAALMITILLTPTAVQAVQTGDTTATLSHAELNQYLGNFIPAMMDSLNIPGFVVVITRSDSILFSKGFGYADIANNQPAHPDSTIWRVASISKVVTATAVMQLVEKGQLDLDTDINNYLKNVEIPNTFDKPITLRHLLTHTTGLDDRYINKSFRNREDLPPLETFIADILPDRIFPPGQVYTYSNIGNAMAALVVEDVTGVDFNTYCRNHIFKPLGMRRTSFTILDEQMQNRLYHAYYSENNQLKEAPFDYLGDYPAGQLLTTGSEFARFIISHLNNGVYKDIRILDSSTVEAMHRTQFTHHPKLNGSVGFGFHLTQEHGNLVSRHGGGYVGLSTRMWLLPEHDLGLFMAANKSDFAIIDSVSHFVVRRYFGNKKSDTVSYPLTNLPQFDPNVETYTGYYRGTRYSHHDITKLFLLAGYGGEVKIWENEKGMLMMYDHNHEERRLIQIEPNVFRSVDDDYHIAFERDEAGQPKFLYTHGTGALEKVPGFYSVAWQRQLFLWINLFFLFTLTGGLIYLIIPAKWKPSGKGRTQTAYLLRHQMLIAGLFVLYPLLLILDLTVIHPAYELMQVGLAYGIPAEMYVIQLLPLATLFTLAIMTNRLILNRKNKEMPIFVKTESILFLAISLFYLHILTYWNAIGFNFG